MKRSLENILLAFFYSEKHFVSRFIAEGNFEWVKEEYRKLFGVIKNYFINHGEVASINVVQEYITNTEDFLYYKSLIEDAKLLKVETSDFPNLMEKFKFRHNKYLINKAMADVQCGIDTKEELVLLNDKIYRLTNELNRLYRVHTYKEGTLKSTARNAYEKYLHEEKNPELIKGKYVGISEIDRITNGLRSPDLFLVVGESGTGKSILCMNMAINLWLGSNNINEYSKDYIFKNDGCNILYFSIEMDYDNMRDRIDCNLAEIDYYRLRDRKLNDEERQKFKQSCIFQSKYGKELFLLDMPRGVTIMDIKAKYEEILNFFTPDVIIVDHLGLMSSVNKGERADWLEMGEVAADLHEFNRRHNKITIAAVQANRPSKNKYHHSTHRIGRSEMIPQNASIIVQIDNREDEEQYADMPVYITKMRNGEKGRFTLYKKFSIMKVCDTENI